MLGRPNPSPAWIVKWKFSRAMRWNASRWRVGGYPASGPAMSKPDHALVPMAHGELGDLDRARRLAHGGDDEPDRDRSALGTAPEAGEHRIGHLVEREATIGQQLGRHPDLGVHDAIGRQVLGALGRDPLDRIARLHDRDRVPESLEIELERLPVGAAREPCRQLVGIGRRQVAIADLGRELEHAARPKPAVEMVVEQHLGCAARELEAQVSGVIHEFENTRSFRSRGY